MAGKGQGAGALERQINCLKYYIFFSNFLAWIFGICIFSLALWIRFQTDFQEWVKEFQMYQYWTGDYILLGGAILVMIVSFFGCCGAILENACMILVFLVALAIIFLVELSGAAYMLSNGISYSQLSVFLTNSFRAGVYSYGDNTRMTSIMRVMQEAINCCGAHSAQDYNVVHKPVPTECRDPVTGNQWPNGCVKAFSSYLELKTGWICGLALVLCVLQITNLVVGWILIKKLRQSVDEGRRYDPVKVTS